jgi:hypothetical protein
MVQPASIVLAAMAMSTRTENRHVSLKRRIQQFYNRLNQGDFSRCRLMIDPRAQLKRDAVTQLQYENSLRQFLDHFGSVKVLEIRIDLHLNEPSRLYEGRDFAVGKTTWEDQAGGQHVFSERWVRDGRVWYTRSTGFMTPETTDGAARC